MSLTPEEWAKSLRVDADKFSRVILLPAEARALADKLERLQKSLHRTHAILQTVWAVAELPEGYDQQKIEDELSNCGPECEQPSAEIIEKLSTYREVLIEVGKALEFWLNDCSYYEPSLSCAQRKSYEALARIRALKLEE